MRGHGFCVVAALAVLSVAAPAAAQTDVCLPPASGVPALSGAPNWWDSALPAPQHWPRPDDPRWRGAFVHLPMPGAAATEHVTFRALRTASSLFLLWHVTVDPVLDDDEMLWVAFSPGPGEDDVLISIKPFNTSNDNIPAVADAALPRAFQVSYSTRTPGNAFAGAAIPTWLDPGGVATHTRVMRRLAQNDWAIFMEVPIDPDVNDGIDLAPAFSMWFEVQVTHTMPNMVPYRFPSAVTFDAVAVSLNSMGWQPTRRTVPTTDPACIRGVSLAVSDVGTDPAGTACTNAAQQLSSDIGLTNGAGAAASNTLCARPLNETGANINAGDLRATFRTANWGTQPDWNSVPNPLNTLWQTVNSIPATGPLIANNARGSLEFLWNMTVGGGSVNDVCTFSPQPGDVACGPLPANPRRRHQCMFVELTGAPGLTFSTSSVYRNMNFVNTASTFSEEAEVSVVGLAARPTPTPQRDVYLYVQTNNMPAQVTGGGPGPDPIPVPTPQPPRPPTTKGDPATKTTGGQGGQGGQVPPLEQSEYAATRDKMPTLQVHAFHDTGVTTTVNGQTFNLLRPQTSFGYFVNHKGPVEGWSNEIVGATEIAPDYYRIRVPENGTATVTTVIETLDLRPWSLSLHGGFNVPLGDFGSECDGRFSFGADLEYRFNSTMAVEAFYGHDRFDCDGAGAHVNHISANGKAYLSTGSVRPFVGGGIGSYSFGPSGTTEMGFNLFGGVQANPRPRLGVEGTVKFHVVDQSGTDSNFLTLHIGLRVRF